MGHLRVTRVVVVLLALSLLAGVAPVSAAMPGSVQSEDGLKIAIAATEQLATDARNKRGLKKTTRPKKGLPIKLGKDGRLTILLIGSDWRRKAGGERLDTLMVATIDPRTGKSAVVSIPRDMSGIPLAGGGNSGGMRINAIYYIRYRDPSLPHGALDRQALKRFTKDVGAFLGTEIDYWALTRFGSFATLVNRLGGVRLDIKEEVLDSSYARRGTRGVWFPKADDYRLRGNPPCKPAPRKCHSALAYVRSRKGTMGSGYNSDWRRAERQQQFVRAAVRQVLDNEGAGLHMLGVFIKARDEIETNIPKTAEAAGQLYALLSKMKLPASNMKVFAPSAWAGTAADGTTKPNLSAIRRWVDGHFYKVKPRKSGD